MSITNECIFSSSHPSFQLLWNKYRARAKLYDARPAWAAAQNMEKLVILSRTVVIYIISKYSSEWWPQDCVLSAAAAALWLLGLWQYLPIMALVHFVTENTFVILVYTGMNNVICPGYFLWFMSVQRCKISTFWKISRMFWISSRQTGKFIVHIDWL